MLHVWNICLHLAFIYGLNVGKSSIVLTVGLENLTPGVDSVRGSMCCFTSSGGVEKKTLRKVNRTCLLT